MYKVENRWNHKEYIKIEWNLGKRCNYDCSYCPSVIHDNYSPHTDINILKQTVDKLNSLGKPVRISLTGGEPCVHPQIEQLIHYIKEKNMFLSITTNGTRTHTWYGLQKVDQYVFSVHFEYDWQKVLGNILALNQIYTIPNIVVHLMCHQDKMVDVRSAAWVCKSENIPYVLRRVRWTEGDHDLFDDMRYDQKDLDWILENNSTAKPNIMLYEKRDKDGDKITLLHANDVIKLHKNQFKGWTCNIGLESLMINYDGDVHRATCRVGGSLGNIYNGTFVIPKEPVTCTRNFCTCAADIPITKINGNL